MLDDPRGQEVDELAFRAERLEKRGESAAARDLYAQAAVIETALARETPSDAPRVRGLLAISAISFWYRARQVEQAEKLASEFLEDTQISPQARADIEAAKRHSIEVQSWERIDPDCP